MSAALLLLWICLLASGPPAGDAEAPTASPTPGERSEQRDGSSSSRPSPSPPRFEERVEVRAALPDDEDVAAFATVIDTADVARRGADLADVLRRVPGARIRDYGGLGSYATISLRASTAEQVTVLVDGVPQNRALGGAVDLSSVPATQIERVSVFRGFGPAAHGLGGIGGVVDVRTRGAAERPQGRFDVLAGELDVARLSAGWSLPAGGHGSLRVGAEALSSDGDFLFLDPGADFDPQDDRLRHRRNNELEQGALLLRGTWERIGAGRLTVGVREQRRERGLPGLDSFPSDTARMEERLRELNAAWVWRRDGRIRALDLLLDGFEQAIEFVDRDGDLGVGAQDQTTRLSGGGAAAVVRFAPGRHRLTVRADARHERSRVSDRALAVRDRGGARRRLFALTAEDTRSFGRWTLAPSVRWEHRDDDFLAAGGGTLPPPAPDVSESEWAGKIGLAHALGPRTSLRGTLGHFHRSPGLLELFGDRGAVVGNPALRAERGLAAELGVERRWGDSPADRSAAAGAPWGAMLEVVVFGRDVDDLIVLVPNSQAVSIARNLAGAEVAGIEGSLALRVPFGLTLDAAATLQRARDTSGGFADSRPLVYQPERSGYLGVGWGAGGLRARWEVTYVGPNSTDVLDTPALRMPSRVIHDATLGFEWPSGLMIGVDVRNLFDRRTRDLARYPLPGRVALVHLGWRTKGGGR